MIRKIIAHRGFAEIYPENTMLAFSEALKLGANAIELDIQTTSDGIVGVFHDQTLDVLTNGTGNFKDNTWETISELILKPAQDKNYPNLKIPKFQDYLEWAKTNDVLSYIEIKGYRTLSDVDNYVELVRDYGKIENCIFISFDLTALQRVRSNDVNVKVAYIPTSIPSEDNLITILNSLGNSELVLDYTSVTDSLILKCGQNAKKLSLYTITSDSQVASFYERGITNFICNLMLGGVVFETLSLDSNIVEFIYTRNIPNSDIVEFVYTLKNNILLYPIIRFY